MFKKYWYQVMVLTLLVSSVAFIYGCGSAASSSGGGGGSATSGKSGKLSDPYIKAAIVWDDMNGDGTYTATIDLVATTDPTGAFTFDQQPSLESIIRILVQGMHLGITYDAQLSRVVDGSSDLNITPLTTMLSNGISAESIRYVLSKYAAITMDADDVRDDPMSGIVLTDLDSIGKIRAAICTYALIQIISHEAGVNGYFDLASIESGPLGTKVQTALNFMGNAVRNSLSNDMLTQINAGLTAGAATIKASIESSPGFHASVNFPAATANDVANSAFAVTRYVIGRSITNSPTFDPCLQESTIESLGQNVGMRFYFARTASQTLMTVTGPFPGTQTFTVYDAIVSRECRDGSNVIITSWEVNSTTEGFLVKPDGTLQVTWHPYP